MHSGNHTVAVDPDALEKSISEATQALLGYRQSDGHWVFELEADSTIPAEYVLLRHYLGEPVDSALEAKIANADYRCGFRLLLKELGLVRAWSRPPSPQL